MSKQFQHIWDFGTLTEKTKDGTKITVLTKDNPKNKGTASFKRFETYQKFNTVGKYIKKYGAKGRADLRNDSEAMFIKFEI